MPSQIGSFLLYGFDAFFIPLLFTLSVAAFVWGYGIYMLEGPWDDVQRVKSITYLIYGFLIFMLSVIIWLVVHYAFR